jgi:hypothetical protein
VKRPYIFHDIVNLLFCEDTLKSGHHVFPCFDGITQLHGALGQQPAASETRRAGNLPGAVATVATDTVLGINTRPGKGITRKRRPCKQQTEDYRKDGNALSVHSPVLNIVL